MLQCINGVSSNLVEGRTKMCQLKYLILKLFGLFFRCIYIYSVILILVYDAGINVELLVITHLESHLAEKLPKG